MFHSLKCLMSFSTHFFSLSRPVSFFFFIWFLRSKNHCELSCDSEKKHGKHFQLSTLCENPPKTLILPHIWLPSFISFPFIAQPTSAKRRPQNADVNTFYIPFITGLILKLKYVCSFLAIVEDWKEIANDFRRLWMNFKLLAYMCEKKL